MLACGLGEQSLAERAAPGLGGGERQSMGRAYVDTDGGRHGELSCEGLRLRRCGSRVSNGRYSGATTADAPLYVVRTVVTAASRRIEEVGRRSCSLFARFLRSIPTGAQTA